MENFSMDDSSLIPLFYIFIISLLLTFYILYTFALSRCSLQGPSFLLAHYPNILTLSLDSNHDASLWDRPSLAAPILYFQPLDFLQESVLTIAHLSVKIWSFSEERKDAIVLLNKEVVKLRTKSACHVKDIGYFLTVDHFQLAEDLGESLYGFWKISELCLCMDS